MAGPLSTSMTRLGLARVWGREELVRNLVLTMGRNLVRSWVHRNGEVLGSKAVEEPQGEVPSNSLWLMGSTQYSELRSPGLGLKVFSLLTFPSSSTKMNSKP